MTRSAFAILLFAGLSACAGPAARESAGTRRAIAEIALAQIGVPYRYGGSDRSGFDCSGLVQYVYANAGVEVPRSTWQQIKAGRRISYSDARVGDLLFYRFGRSRNASLHVAIYLGDDLIVHAPATGREVSETRADQDPWSKRYITTVRILP